MKRSIKLLKFNSKRVGLVLSKIQVFLLLGFLLSCQKDDGGINDLNTMTTLKNDAVISSSGVIYFDHKIFSRLPGIPIVESCKIENEHFEHFDGNFILKIKNGNDKSTMVSSAEIWIDGNLVLNQSDFSKYQSFISKSIKGLTSESIITVKLNSTPGSYIDLWIEGYLKPCRAIVGDEGGVINFSLSEGNIVLNVPPATFSKKEIIFFTEIENQSYIESFEKFGFSPLTKIIDLKCTESIFNNPITLKVFYPENVILAPDDEELIWFFQYDMEKDQFISFDRTILNTEENSLEVELSHFTPYTWGPYSFRWVSNTISYFIKPDISGILWGDNSDPYRNINSIVNAIESWEPYQNQFKFRKVNSESEANIVIAPTSLILGGLGVTWVIFDFSEKGEPDKVKIEICDNPQKWQSTSIVPEVVAHEVGHALGLKHYINNNLQCQTPTGVIRYAMMSAPSFTVNRSITNCDIAQLQTKYGSPMSVIAENTEINAWKWFGGDDRPEIYHRNVGTGQSFTLNRNYTMTSVSLLFEQSPGFESYFDYANNPDHAGHAVDIRLQLRDQNGNILNSTQKHIDDTFTGGWIKIDWPTSIQLTSNQKYILTWYLINGEYSNLTNASPGDKNAGFALGEGYSGEIRRGGNLDNWNNWYIHPWDFCFKIHGN